MNIPKTSIRIVIGIIALSILIIPSAVLASVSPNEGPGEDNLIYLLVGQIIAWAAFFSYAFYMSRKTNEMRIEIDNLRDLLSK